MGRWVEQEKRVPQEKTGNLVHRVSLTLASHQVSRYIGKHQKHQYTRLSPHVSQVSPFVSPFFSFLLFLLKQETAARRRTVPWTSYSRFTEIRETIKYTKIILRYVDCWSFDRQSVTLRKSNTCVFFWCPCLYIWCVCVCVYVCICGWPHILSDFVSVFVKVCYIRMLLEFPVRL